MIKYPYKPKGSRIYRARLRFEKTEKLQDFTLGTSDKRVANKRLDEIALEQERERAGLIPSMKLRESAALPLSDHLRDFLADRTRVGRNAEYVRRLDQRIRRLMRDCNWVYARDVDADSFRKWREADCERIPNTLNEYLASIRNLLTWMKQQGRIDRIPLEDIARIDEKGQESYQRRAFSPDEVKRMIAVAGKYGIVYLTAVVTGLRRGELEQLEWQDVQLDCDEPHVVLRPETTKSKRSAIQWLTDECATQLHALRGAQFKQRDRVFAGLVPKRERVKQHLEAAGIPVFDERGRKVDLHALRMTLNTWAAANGMPERQRQEMMRHKNAVLTNRTYMDENQLETRNWVMRLPHLLDQASQIDSQELVTDGHTLAQSDANATEPSISKMHPGRRLRREVTNHGTKSRKRELLEAGGIEPPSRGGLM
ncbi:MAG: hypothetical protein DHS20C16_02770 [Phycisphaerae bacterium]|nr:MAG: hypothetical protein DHS20C16_02770 [Phycisphaerae bacterium]